MRERSRQSGQKYSGIERRKHQLYVTKNTEYHLRDGVCVAVRDRHRGTWRLNHKTLNRSLTGAVRFTDGDARPTFENPEVGDALFFGEGGGDVVTSSLLDVRRPDKGVVDSYPL